MMKDESLIWRVRGAIFMLTIWACIYLDWNMPRPEPTYTRWEYAIPFGIVIGFLMIVTRSISTLRSAGSWRYWRNLFTGALITLVLGYIVLPDYEALFLIIVTASILGYTARVLLLSFLIAIGYYLISEIWKRIGW
jgi:hypothetical protein